MYKDARHSFGKAMPKGAETLPGPYYHDVGFHARELEILFRKMWICAGRVDDVPEPGNFVTRTIGSDNILIVRDASGAIGAFHNICRHRGTRICDEASGALKGSIQCPYHAWTYSLDGKLIGAPHMNEVQGFDKGRYGLHRIGCEVWDGHVFINFSSDRQPLLDQIKGLPERVARFGAGELRRWKRITYDVKANWKLIVQNYGECYHCPLIHPDLNRVTHYLSGANDAEGENYNGGYQIIGDEYCTLTVEGKPVRPHFKGLRDEDHNRVYYYIVFPNLLLSLHPDYMMTHTVWPRGPRESLVICEWHFDAAEMARPGFSGQDAVDFWDMTNRQDWRACELSQLGVESSAYAPGPYSLQEDFLYNFDTFVRRKLEGAPDHPRRVVGEG